LSDKLEPDAENLTIKGFTFDNLRIDNYYAQAGSNTNLITGNVIENNIFSNVMGTAVYLRDGRDAPGSYSSGVSVSYNKIISPASAGGVDYNAGSGILVYGAENSSIVSNVVTNPAYNGIQLARDNAMTVSGNIATGCAQPALQIAQWNDGTNTISDNTFSTTSTSKAAVRLYGFTNNYYPVFSFSGNTIQNSKYGIQIGREDTGLNDIINADYSFTGNTFTNITDHKLIVYLTSQASPAEVAEMDTYFAQIYGSGSRSQLITSSTPYTYVVEMGPVQNVTRGTYYWTIQAAINDAITTNGDHITVAAGTYNLSGMGGSVWEPVSVTKSLTITGAGSGTTILDATGSSDQCDVVAIRASNVTIEGFTIKNGTYGLRIPGYAYASNVSNLSFTDVVVEYNRASGVVFDGLTVKSDITFDECSFNHNGGRGLYSAGGTINNIELTNCIASYNVNSGVNLQGTQTNVTITGGEYNYNTGVASPEAYGSGIWLEYTTGAEINGVTAIGNGSIYPSHGIYVKSNSAQVDITNCEISNSLYGIFYLSVTADASNDATGNVISNCTYGLADFHGKGNTHTLNEISNCANGIYLGGTLGVLVIEDNILNDNPIQVKNVSTLGVPLDMNAVLANNTYDSAFLVGQVIYRGFAIDLVTGWNLISSPIVPEDLDMEAVLAPLIDGGYLIKAQDEAGNALIYNNGWINNMPDFAMTEGYYVKVNADCTLPIFGDPVSLPMTIDLATGWNIISYPYLTPEAAMTILQPLIDDGKLVKAQNDQGGTIIYNNGQWIDTLGNFETGEGYYVKVNAPTQLIHTAPSKGRSAGQNKSLDGRSKSKNTNSDRNIKPSIFN